VFWPVNFSPTYTYVRFSPMLGF